MSMQYRGASHFRQRLLLATLSGRTIRIDDIRADEADVGMRECEISFLRLLEKVVNGCGLRKPFLTEQK